MPSRSGVKTYWFLSSLVGLELHLLREQEQQLLVHWAGSVGGQRSCPKVTSLFSSLLRCGFWLNKIGHIDTGSYATQLHHLGCGYPSQACIVLWRAVTVNLLCIPGLCQSWVHSGANQPREKCPLH